jgi:hypothetical protein
MSELWRFSDGTTVELGGNVEGPTLLAQRLRQQIASVAEQVQIWPQPGGEVPLDVSDAAILDQFLRDELDFWTRVRGLKLKLTRPDDVPELPPPPWAGQPHDPDVIY